MFVCTHVVLAAFETAVDNRWWILGVALFGVAVTVGFVLILPVAAQRRKPGPVVAPNTVVLTTARDRQAMRPTRWAFLGIGLVAAVASAAGAGSHEHFQMLFRSLLGWAVGLILLGTLFGLNRTLPDITYEELHAKKPVERGGLGKAYSAVQLAPEFKEVGRWLAIAGGTGLLISWVLRV